MTKEELFMEFQNIVISKRDSLNKAECPEGYAFEEYNEGWRSAFGFAIDILADITTKQPSIPSDVDEAAREYSLDVKAKPFGNLVKEAFKAGAEWMAGQGVSFEGQIAEFSEDGMKYIESKTSEEDMINTLKLNVSDKVIVQIRRKE